MPIVEICAHTGERRTVTDITRHLRGRGLRGDRVDDALRSLNSKGTFDTEHYWYRLEKPGEPFYPARRPAWSTAVNC